MKKFKLLSSLLTAVMVLSMLSVMPVGATQLYTSDAFFNDFEDFSVGGGDKAQFSANGFKSYNLSRVETGTTFSIASEGDYGHVLKSANGGYLYIPFDNPVTSGKVSMGFSLNTTGAFGHIQAALNAPMSSSAPARSICLTGQKYIRILDGEIPEDYASSESNHEANTWHYIKVVVDVEENSWTIYRDGEEIGKHVWSTDIKTVYGFSFYLNGKKSGFIDNISVDFNPNAGVRALSSKTSVNSDGDTEISAILTEWKALDKDNVKVMQCGTDVTATVKDVKVVGNKVAVTVGGTMEAGFEYVVDCDGAEIFSYTEPSEGDNVYVKSVRYTDASGKVKGGNTISPETTKIDITFSKAIDSDAMNAITLTADGDNVAITNRKLAGKTVTVDFDMLPGGSAVELTIPVADRVYKAVTTEGKFEISNLDIAVDGAEAVITANVINTDVSRSSITVVYAFYNDDKLVDMGAEDILLTKTYKLDVEEAFTIRANVAYDKVKAFVWDGLTTAIPLIAEVSYPAQ